MLKSISSVKITRAFPANIAEADKAFFTKLLSTNVAEINVVHLKNSSVIFQGTVIKNLAVLKRMSLFNDEGQVTSYRFRDLLSMFFLWPRFALKKNINYFIVHNNYSHTYYHWMVEAMPRLYLIREYLTSGILLLPDSHNEKFHRECLEIFGIDHVEFLKQKVRYVVPDLILSTQIGTIANYNPDVLKDMVQFIKSQTMHTLDLGQKLYISRSKASRRKVINESEVERYLIELGFRIVNLEDYTFNEQVSIMHHCATLIGLHGAGLVNMIFMNEGGSVLELKMHDEGVNYFYFSLASAQRHHYFYQFCDSANNSVSVQDADIKVDLSLLKENLQLMGL